MHVSHGVLAPAQVLVFIASSKRQNCTCYMLPYVLTLGYILSSNSSALYLGFYSVSWRPLVTLFTVLPALKMATLLNTLGGRGGVGW